MNICKNRHIDMHTPYSMSWSVQKIFRAAKEIIIEDSLYD